MSFLVFLAIGVSLSVASFLQSVAGFGLSLVALPLVMSVKGISPVEAIAITIIGSTMQRVLFMRKLGGHIDWKEMVPLFSIGLAGLLIGVGLLYAFSNLNKSTFKQIIGLLILTTLCLRWFLKIKPTEVFKLGWGLFAAFISGILTGFANIGGPPMVMWILSHKWSQEKMRIVITAFTICFVPFQLILYWILFGNAMPITFLKSLAYFPFVFVGTYIGLSIGNKMNAVTIRTIMYIVLIIICISSIVEPMLRNS